MSHDLSDLEVRVLGSLLEKDLSTPEYYPLSLNALVSACNQKTNREPVVSYDESTAYAGLELLRERRLAAFVNESGSRVEKYRHRISEQFNLTRGELAVLTVMLLRGPQTLNELKERSARMHPFADLEAVQHVLERLAERSPEPLTILLPKLAGTKEPRWMHLLSGQPDVESMQAQVGAAPQRIADPGLAAKVETLQSTVDRLLEEMHEMRQVVDRLRRLIE